MSKQHVHEWIWWKKNINHAGVDFYCDECDEILPWKQAVIILNEYETLKAATERLSAKVARRNGAILRMSADGLSYGTQTQG